MDNKSNKSNKDKGIIWHNLLDRYFKGENVDEMLKEQNKIINTDLFNQIKIYVLDYVVKGYKVIQSEHSTSYNIADLILTDPKTDHRIIIDWKYSGKTIDKIITDNKEQLFRYMKETNVTVIVYHINSSTAQQIYKQTNIDVVIDKNSYESTKEIINEETITDCDSTSMMWYSNKSSKMFIYNNQVISEVHRKLVIEVQEQGPNKNYLNWISNKDNWQNKNYCIRVKESIRKLYQYDTIQKLTQNIDYPVAPQQ